jgi:hypothetical protein
LRALQRTPANRVEAWEGGEYRRLLLVDDQRGYLYFCMLGWRLLRQGIIAPTGSSEGHALEPL